MKTIVVAFDTNKGIGANNDLLWQRDVPADLKHFKDLTTGHSIIMGRRTFESIGRPLPNRQNIVMSRSLEPVEGISVAHSLEEAYQLATGEIFVIGGARVYQEALSTVDQLLVTEIAETFPQATAFFPAIDETIWQETAREHHDADELNKYAYDFVTYIRR